MNFMVLPPALKSLLPAHLQDLCEGERIKKGSLVFRAGKKPTWMYYVVKGEVTLERTGIRGEPVVLQRTRQGFISEASLRVDHYHCDALTILDTQVIKLPVQPMLTTLGQDPLFANRWMMMLNQEVRRLRLHLERLSMKSIRDRLIHLIEIGRAHV